MDKKWIQKYSILFFSKMDTKIFYTVFFKNGYKNILYCFFQKWIQKYSILFFSKMDTKIFYTVFFKNGYKNILYCFFQKLLVFRAESKNGLILKKQIYTLF